MTQELKRRCDRAVLLEGDWCWDADPFVVNDETKAMVFNNIIHLLRNFLRCSAYETVIFNWVLHQQAILEQILGELDLREVDVYWTSLVASEKVLTERLKRDIEAGKREPDVLERSLRYLPLYREFDHRIDTSDLSPEEVATIIIKGLRS